VILPPPLGVPAIPLCKFLASVLKIIALCLTHPLHGTVLWISDRASLQICLGYPRTFSPCASKNAFPSNFAARPWFHPLKSIQNLRFHPPPRTMFHEADFDGAKIGFWTHTSLSLPNLGGNLGLLELLQNWSG